MIREDNERLSLRCNHCTARLDLGPAHVVRARNRTPSGWVRTGPDTHACPLCAPNNTLAAMFAHNAGHRAQPLL